MKNINTVILIDDDPTSNYINQAIIETTLTDIKVEIFTAAIEALEFLNTNLQKIGKTLILLDIKMPEMDGFEFLEAFSYLSTEDKKDAEIVMLSSSSLPKEKEKSKQLGAVGYIEKPLTVNKFNLLV